MLASSFSRFNSKQNVRYAIREEARGGGGGVTVGVYVVANIPHTDVSITTVILTSSQSKLSQLSVYISQHKNGRVCSKFAHCDSQYVISLEVNLLQFLTIPENVT
jgi:hypothetical protein